MFARFCRLRISCAACGGGLLFGAGLLHAAAWEWQPALSLSEVYADNILLSPATEPAQHERITQLAPVFLLRYPGRRFSIRMDYRAQHLNYAEESTRNETFQQLNADTSTALLGEVLWLDAAATRNQQVVNPEERVPLRNISGGNNLTDIETRNISPYLRFRFAGEGESQLRYRNGNIHYAQPSEQLVDSDIDSIEFFIRQQQAARLLNWEVDFSRDEVAYNSGVENMFQRSSASLNIGMGGRTFLLFGGGREDNRFNSVLLQDREGSFWFSGLRWEGTNNNEFEMRIGERFFGHTGMLRWRVNGRYLTMVTRYSEELFTDAQRQLERAGEQPGNFSQPLISQVASEVFIRRRSEMNIDYDKSKTRLSLALLDEQREFQGSGIVEGSEAARLEWLWRLAPRSRLSLNLGWRVERFRDGASENRVSESGLRFSRDLSSRSQYFIETLHERAHAPLAANDYHANYLTVGMQRSF